MYQMPIKAIKRIVGEELASHYAQACQSIYNDVQREFLHRGYHDLAKSSLESCTSYKQLDDFIGEWYRMSLEEWINSL